MTQGITMPVKSLSRRAGLLAALALLPGCGALDSLFGERKTPLPGERRSVLRADPVLAADSGVDPRAVALPAPERIADWPMAGGPAHHGPGHGALAETARQIWRADAGSGSGARQRMTAGPIVAGGTVFAVDAFATVSAFTLDEGRRLWRTTTEKEKESAVSLGGGAAFADGVLYVATGLAEVLALNPVDGSITWRSSLPAPARGAPTVSGGRVFVATLENQLIALSATNGDRQWAHRAAPVITMPLGLPAPAVEGETVVAGFGSGELTALRATDGRLIWAESLGVVGAASLSDLSGIVALPVIDRGRVYAVGVANTTLAIDLRSGRRLWERAFGGEAGVAAAGEWVFAVTRAGEALALGREDGRIRWVTELDPSPAEGRRRGEPARFGQPILAGGRVLIPSSRGEVLALDPAGGAVAGRIPLSSGVTLPAALAQDTLVLLGDDGTLMAVR
jgi:outer membrane protein assembly factor BamB